MGVDASATSASVMSTAAEVTVARPRRRRRASHREVLRPRAGTRASPARLPAAARTARSRPSRAPSPRRRRMAVGSACSRRFWSSAASAPACANESIRKSRRVSPSRPLKTPACARSAATPRCAAARPPRSLQELHERALQVLGRAARRLRVGRDADLDRDPRPSSAPWAPRHDLAQQPLEPGGGGRSGRRRLGRRDRRGVEPSAAGRPRVCTIPRRRVASPWIARMAAARFSRASSR